jgi:hypothetical protein
MKSRTLTLATLVALGACEDQRNLFHRNFGDSVEITVALCVQHAAEFRWGWAAVPPEQADKAVFYHEQDENDMKYGHGLHLAWTGDGAEIGTVFRANGFSVEWDGSNARRILIKETQS